MVQVLVVESNMAKESEPKLVVDYLEEVEFRC